MIAIKPAKLKDFASLMQLEVLPEQKHAHLPFEQAYHNRSKYEVILTLSVDHHPIGYLVVDKAFSHYATFARRNELGLKYIVLDKNYQRQGWGKKAMQKLFVYANAINADSDSLCVTLAANDESSQGFFAALGFNEEAKLFFGKNGKERIMRHKL
ncbi:GNAT family N-acetyltransferase [Vibrio panuliri]|uniref:GNAT family N-acetyltransferase n=1 Tax=Vibrio panuliri TaxID=1381081 RepID=A0A1Q9HIW4_9VIBR|nr:GNAT family N-acetyltransferase [Vibrio panuliri]OLQ90272.1 GNAT family N-acetyltransferase [Vibrio panuliri]